MAVTTLRRLHETVGQMQKNLECSICLELLQDPVSTKCDHQFCSFCIQSLLAARKKPSAPCPLCKEPITKRSLTKNDRMNEIVNAVRGVADAIEQDTGIRCTPPKGPPRLSQSSSQSGGSTNENLRENKEATTKQKKNKPKSRTRQNVRCTQSRRPAQQVQVYIDSDQSDSEGHEIQLATTNTNISSSFPISTRGKGKKGRRNQPARRTRRNHQDEEDVVLRNHVSSNNAHNSLLNAVGPDASGKTLQEQVKGVSGNKTLDHNETSMRGDGALSGIQESNLLEILNEGSLGLSKENEGRGKIDTNGEVPDEENSLPGNTELVADIFGLSPSSQNQRTESLQVINLEDNNTCCLDVDDEQPPVTAEFKAKGNKNVDKKEVEEKRTDVRSVTKVNISDGKENSQLPTEGDPYEFIPSQRTPRKVKSKPGRRKKATGGVSYTTGKLKFGKKGTGTQRTVGAASKRKAGSKKSCSSDTEKEITVIDEDEITHHLEGTKETHSNKTKPTDINSSKGKGDKPHESQNDMNGNEINVSDRPQKDIPSEDTGNMRIEGLFASQQTNDSCDLDDDRGLPLYDYGDSSDEETTLCSDGSYKPGGRVLRRGVGMNEADKMVTRRKKLTETKELESNDADESSASANEEKTGPSLRKRKNVKPGERRSTRARNKQAASDSSFSTNDLEDGDGELEVSYIQEHLQECNDEKLYIDGDSQRVHEDNKGGQQKTVKNTSATKTNETEQSQQSALESANNKNLNDDMHQHGHEKLRKSIDDIQGKSSKSIHSPVANKVKSREEQQTLLSSNVGEEVIVIEDDHEHDKGSDKTHPGKECSSANEMSNPFKKPSTNLLKKSRLQLKSKQDLTTNSVTSNKETETNLEASSFRPKNDNARQFQDPDEGELTLVDSQRERKKRSPGGANIFFSAYKRGSIRLTKRSTHAKQHDEGDDIDDDDDDGSDDDITLADVFGDDADNALGHRDDTRDGLDEEEEEMDISDAQELSASDDDLIKIDERKKDEESNNTFNKVKEKSEQQNQDLPKLVSDEEVLTSEDEQKRTTRKSSRDRKGRSKSEDPSELHQLNKQLSSKKSNRASHPLTKKQLEESHEIGNVTEKRSRYSAKKSEIEVVQVEDLTRTSGHADIKQVNEKDVKPVKRSSRSRSRDKTKANKRESLVVPANQNTDVPAKYFKPSKELPKVSGKENMTRNNEVGENSQDTLDNNLNQDGTRDQSCKDKGSIQEKVTPVKSDYEVALELARDQSCKDKGSIQENVTPVKSDYEIALELARDQSCKDKGSIQEKVTPVKSDYEIALELARDQSCKDKESIQENVTPVKSDWEIALELAREFDTEPRQFRLRSGQKISDELAGNRSSRRNGRRKPELSLSNVPVTIHAKDIAEKQIQSQWENLNDIDSFTTEDSESMKSTESQPHDVSQPVKQSDLTLHVSSKERSSKKSKLQSKKRLQNHEPNSDCEIIDPENEQHSANINTTMQKDGDKKGAKKNKKGSEFEEDHNKLKEPKQVIPETPLLPEIQSSSSIDQESNLAKEASTRRRSLRARVSLQTSNELEEAALTLSGDLIKSNQMMSSLNQATQQAGKSPKVIPQTPMVDLSEATNFDLENDIVLGDSEMSLKGTKSVKRRTRSSNLSANMTGDSTDDEVPVKNLKGFSGKKQTENKRPMKSFGRQNTSQSCDVEVKDFENSESRERPLRRSGRNRSTPQSSDAEVMDHEISKNHVGKISPTQRNNTTDLSHCKEKAEMSRKQQNITKSSDTENDQNISASGERKNRSQTTQCKGHINESKKTSGSGTLSRRATRASDSSEAENTDHDDSRRKDKVVKSRDQQKKKVSTIDRPLRRSGRGKTTPQSSDAESTNLEYSRTPKKESMETPVFIAPSDKQSKLHLSKPATLQQKDKQLGQTSNKGDSKIHCNTPEKSSSTPAHLKLTRKSPRLSGSSPSVNSKKRAKADLPPANSATLFSEEDSVSKKDGEKATTAKDAGKGSDTTESIEIEVSNEEYEQENPDVQLLPKQQENNKEDLPLPTPITNVNDKFITRRSKNKLRRNRKQHSDNSTNTTKTSTFGTETEATTKTSTSSTETEAMSMSSDGSESVNTNTVDPTPRPKRKSLDKVDEKVQQQEQDKKKNQKHKSEKKDETQQLASVSGSETESLCSPLGSESDIFRYSDLSPNKDASGNLEKPKPSQKETMATGGKTHKAVDVEKQEESKAVQDVAQDTDTSPQLGSGNVATCGSSLQSEPLLVPPPHHYQDHFVPVEGNKEILISETTCVEESKKDKCGGRRRQSKRKSFTLGISSPGSEQQSKKRKSGEMDVTDDCQQNRENRNPALRRSGRRSRQQSENVLERPDGKKMASSPLDADTNHKFQPRQIEVVPKDALEASIILTPVASGKLDKDDRHPGSDSLQTRRRSRTSGSRHSSRTNSPRNVSAVQATDGEVLSCVNTDRRKTRRQVVERVVDLSLSPQKKQSQKLSGSTLTPTTPNDSLVTSPRRSARIRHSSNTSSVVQQEKVPSQIRSSAPLEEEDHEIVNSGSLFGTQNRSQQEVKRPEQKSISSQTAFEEKTSVTKEKFKDYNDDEEDILNGSQCMFGSDPNSSSEHDVEMMSAGSEEDIDKDEVEEIHAPDDPKIPQHSHYSEAGEKAYDQILNQSCSSNHQMQRNSELVTTIPESVQSAHGMADQETPSSRSNKKSDWKNSNEENSKDSGRKSQSSGSASTRIAASEGASISPDKLSQPIPLGKRQRNSIEQSGQQSRSNSKSQSQNSATSRKSGDRSSGKPAGKSVMDDDSNVSKHTRKNSNDVSSNVSQGKPLTRKEKKKPQKLSDIDLSDCDVDGDYDLLFEEDEVMTLTPVISDGRKQDKIISNKEENDAGDDENEEVPNDTRGKEHLLPKTSSPQRHSKDGKSTENIKDDMLETNDEVESRKERMKTNDVEEVQEARRSSKVLTEEESDGEAMEVGSDDDLGCEEMEEKGSQEEGSKPHDTQQDGDVEEINKDLESTEEVEEEDEDDLIPPTPPCANTTISSLSKSHVGSKSFLSSFQYPATIRSTQSNSNSSTSFSNQSSKSFIFKHPSATHSQRAAKPKPASVSASPMTCKMELHSESIVQKDKDSSRLPDKEKEVSNEPQSLEESQSLSIFHNATDTAMDLNVIPEKSQIESSRKISPKSKSRTRRENLSENVSDKEEVAGKQEHNYVERKRRRKRRGSGVRSQLRNGDEDELMACPFLLSEDENITPNEPANNEEKEEQDASSSPTVVEKKGRKNTKDGSKSSTSDEKGYDTEASLCSEDSSSTSHHLNLTSASSVMSSQSELMSTQQQLKAQKTLQKMEQEIAQMEATLAKGGPADHPVLASDSDDDSSKSDSDLDKSEEDGKLPQVVLDDDDDVSNHDCVEDDPSETNVHHLENHEDQDVISPRKQSKKISEKNMDISGQKLASGGGSTRRSQRLVFSDEDSESGEEQDDNAKRIQYRRQSRSSKVSHSYHANSNHGSDNEPLDTCPRSPSPPPPLTQGTIQRYSERTPLQDTLKNVTKLAEQYKSSSSGSAKSREGHVRKHQRRRQSESSNEGLASGSYRSRKGQVDKRNHHKRLGSASDSSDEDDIERRESQRRNVKRRLRSESDSSDEEPRSLKKSARSSRNSTPRSSGKEARRESTKSVRKSVNKSQDQSLDTDRTQLTRHDNESSRPNSVRNTPNGDQRSSSKKDASSSRTLPKSSPTEIENTLHKSSRNNLTQSTSNERGTGPKSSLNEMALHNRSPASSARIGNQGSPIMELSCQRTLMQEDSAPVVAKNLRKNDGRFSFVATGLSRQELREVERLAKLTGCKFASMFNANTTHVIINTDEDLVCERTLKYFQGIAARVWIVSYAWIEACLKTGDLLLEEGFEVQGDVVNGRKHGGPERARTWKGKPLMHNYEICSVGPYSGLNKDQLVSLLELCGSTTVQHPTLFPFDVGHQFYIVVQQNCSHTQQDYDALYKKYRVPVISREWVLDCVATYTLQPVDDYILSGDQPIIELDSDVD